MTASDPEVAARATLALLQNRLHRLEFLLTGITNEEGIPELSPGTTQARDNVWSRLDSLSSQLASLKTLSGPAGVVVKDIDRLSSTHPDLFSLPTKDDSEIPQSEDTSTIAAVVLSHASLFSETAARLSSLQTLQTPSAEDSAKLVALMPRLEECQAREQRMEAEVRELRERSARCLEWWVKIGVVAMGDMWENWEKRISDAERSVIRGEKRAKEERGYL